MAYTLGIVLSILGILVAVCLHEAGHMGTAKAFGMKVTRYFAGFGPTIWSFRRGETEYGIKALPLGGFVKIVGMTPQEDDVSPEDEPRAMWRFPVWKRTVVLAAGSVTHFILAFVVLWVMFVMVGVPDRDRIDTEPARVGSVYPCVKVIWELNSSGTAPKECGDGDPRSPAQQAELKPGDVITAINGEKIKTYATLRDRVKALGDTDATLTVTRQGREFTKSVRIHAVDRIKDTVDQNKTIDDITQADLERAGMIGVGPQVPTTTSGPVEGLVDSAEYLGTMTTMTFQALGTIPSKIPNLLSSLTGEERDPDTPVSVIGVTRLGGELTEQQDWTSVLSMYALLNLFFGLFNLLPLLPMDGGHIAIAWFEKIRSWTYGRLGRSDPGRVDYQKLTPVTLTVLAVLVVFVLITGTADIINPITIAR